MRNKAFTEPQRQSVTGIVIMFFDTVRQYARAIWPLLVIWALRFQEMNKLYIALGLAAILLSTIVIAYLKFVNFTFWLDEANDEFIISEGVFNKTRTAIRLDRIQQVNIGQSLIQRIIGVYSLEVDTAGSNDKEGKIKAVSHDIAQALKLKLLDNNRVSPILSEESLQVPEPVSERPFMKIGFASLLKVGFTSNYVRTVGLILAFFVTIFENLRQLTESQAIDSSKIDTYFDQIIAAQPIISFVIFLLVAVLVINVARTVVKFFGFEIRRQQGSLLLSYGLINTKSTILKPEKVQITTISRNYFQKKLDVTEMRFRQAAAEGKQARKSVIEIPGCSAPERDEILRLLFSEIPETGVPLLPNIRKLIFSVFLAIVLPLCVFFAVKQNVSELNDFVIAVPVYVAFTLLILIFSYRNYKLFVGERFIIKQSGAWDVSRQIIEPGKIQAISVSQLFWHRNLNIASLTLHTAGGKMTFNLGNYQKIKAHTNRWLYQIERSDSNWM